MTARLAWLEQWCPYCHAAPGGRCLQSRWDLSRPARCLHVARGWLERPCSRCKAPAGGHPLVRGDVIWTADDRRAVIVARRGERRFGEPAR
jgi:hypothetical protein